METIISIEKATKVYDILVEVGGASESMLSSFIYHHCTVGCGEWRFGGFLGYGGKYFSQINRVCYKGDSEVRNSIRLELNESLAKL